MAILPNTEKQREPVQTGGWQKQMARRRYQKGSIRRRGKRNPVWELLWREEFFKKDGRVEKKMGFKGLCRGQEFKLRQARKMGEEELRPDRKSTPPNSSH